MAVLRSETRNRVLVSDLKVARRFWDRGRGLLGRVALPAEEALWILRCNSIHTFFMMFPIDCVFVNRNLEVKALRRNVVPWRLVLPVWGASSVIEMAAGSIDRLEITAGEKLHVGA